MGCIGDGWFIINWTLFSLGRFADDVFGEDVSAASYGEPHAELVVLEDIVGHIGVERLQHGHASISIVVDVVAWSGGKRGAPKILPTLESGDR